MGNQLVGVLASIVILAIVTTLVLPGRNTQKIVASGFSGFAGSIRAAMGR